MNSPQESDNLVDGPAISHGEGDFNSAGTRLHWSAFSPEKPVASAVFLHGRGEYHRRYTPLMQSLASNQIACYGLDLRGHGQSAGERTHLENWDQYLDDLTRFIQFIRSLESDRKIFLIGQDIGALLALDYAVIAPEDVSGVVACAVPMRSAAQPVPWTVRATRAVEAYFNPIKRIPLNLKGDDTVSIESIALAFDRDANIERNVTLQWQRALEFGITRMRAEACDIEVPVFLVHGALDPVHLTAGVNELLGLIKSHDKRLKIYPQSRHQVALDVEANELAYDVSNWILPRAGYGD